MEELQSLSKTHNSEKGGNKNDLYELYKSEEKIIPVISDFESIVKKADTHEELDSLNTKIEELRETLDLEDLPVKDD